MMWPIRRAEDLTRRAGMAFAGNVARYCFCPSDATSSLSYFSDLAIDELAGNEVLGCEYLPPSRGFHEADLVIVTSHGEDLSENLWALRMLLKPDALVVTWAWDNHLGAINNLKTSMASDFVFPSHAYCVESVSTPVACLSPHLPACSAQWSCGEARQFFRGSGTMLRSGRLLANYVDYPFSWRSQLLHELQRLAPEVEVNLMQPSDRSRYFSMSRADRFKEWMSSKSTLILPIDRDLSTRVFDALLAGLVLVVPSFVEDFDRVIGVDDQAMLGVIKIDSCEVDSIRQAALCAEQLFDAEGDAGAVRRHQYALSNHMLPSRISAMLGSLRELALGDASIAFDGGLTLQAQRSEN